MVVKAIIVSDSNHKFRDLSDLIQVSRSIGKQVFKTKGHVLVKQIFGPYDYGYVVVIECECSNDPVKDPTKVKT